MELSAWTWAGLQMSAALLTALLVSAFFNRVVSRVVQSTDTELDDILARNVRTPVALSVALGGTWWALHGLELSDTVTYVHTGLLTSAAIVLWTVGLNRVTEQGLEWVAARSDQFPMVSPRTLPVFDIAGRTFTYGGALYFLFLAWHVDLTGWLASAGIVGIAVGFAARDTLANLFAGIFILADAPYKLGDYLILDSGDRGQVIEIGIRATRLLTRDDVEIIVPNATMANVKVINESGGPSGEAYRVRATVEVAYGSDIDQVRALLLDTTEGIDDIRAEPTPRVRFREFGSSGLKLQLLCWVQQPVMRGRVLDKLNTRIYKSFAEHGIEIPYSKHDVYLRQAEAAPRGAASPDGVPRTTGST